MATCCGSVLASDVLQSTVERLNDAMESGEEEMDAAFRRTSKLCICSSQTSNCFVVRSSSAEDARAYR